MTKHHGRGDASDKTTTPACLVADHSVVRDARGHVGYLSRAYGGTLLCTATTGFDLAADAPVTVVVSAEDLASAYVLAGVVRTVVDGYLTEAYRMATIVHVADGEAAL